jgi:hypothetical protein
MPKVIAALPIFRRSITPWLNGGFIVTVIFFDRQNLTNPLNGTTIDNSQSLRAIIGGLQYKQPFFSELIGEDGNKILLGIATAVGCAQFSSTEGTPPYLMAVSGSPEEVFGARSFLIGDTATPVARRFCLSMEKVVEIAVDFLETGKRSDSVEWEEI